ncbi:hypothetical protein FRC08_000226 [Ceratobasidium sp. 394]|nr:hypothetical protein FRC08_000226 [Ceratobasidium sp. 394]
MRTFFAFLVYSVVVATVHAYWDCGKGTRSSRCELVDELPSSALCKLKGWEKTKKVAGTSIENSLVNGINFYIGANREEYGQLKKFGNYKKPSWIQPVCRGEQLYEFPVDNGGADQSPYRVIFAWLERTDDGFDKFAYCGMIARSTEDIARFSPCSENSKFSFRRPVFIQD